MEISRIPLTSIRAQRYGRRAIIDHEQVRSLAESFGSVGQLQPIVVVNDGDVYRLIAGRRRLEAATICGWAEIDAVIRTYDEEHEAGAALAENLARVDLPPVEEGVLLKQALEGSGMTIGAVSKTVGRSDSWVRQRLSMLDWPPEFQEVANDGALSVSALGKLLEVTDLDYRHHLLMCGINGGATAAQVQRWVTDWRMNQSNRTDEELNELAHAPSVQEAEIRQSCLMCESMTNVLQGGWFFVCKHCESELARVKYQERLSAQTGS